MEECAVWTRSLMFFGLCLTAASISALETPPLPGADVSLSLRDVAFAGPEPPEPILPPPPSLPSLENPAPLRSEPTIPPIAEEYLLPRPYDSCPAEIIGDGRPPCAEQVQPKPCCDYWLSPCNLVPHLPYPPAAHGWYYFRPYNVDQLPQIRQVVIGWGGDPRNPCSNEIFQSVYRSVKEPSGSGIKDGSGSPQRPWQNVILDGAQEPARIDASVPRELITTGTNEVMLNSVKGMSKPERNSQPDVVLNSPAEVVLNSATDESESGENPQREVILKWLWRLEQQLPDNNSQNEIRSESPPAPLP